MFGFCIFFFKQKTAYEMRISDWSSDVCSSDLAFAPVAERFQMRWTLRFSADRPRVAIMASKEPHCLHDLLNRWRTGELDIEVPVVVSTHPDHAAIAAGFGVEYAHVPTVAGHQAAQDAAGEKRLVGGKGGSIG